MLIRRANGIIGYTIAIVLAGFTGSHAQSWDMHFNVGFASYSHPELRKYQEYLLRELIVPGEATETFPPYFTFAVGVNKNWAQWKLGFEVGHGSTGGRIYYQDYSGKLVADQLLYYNYLGITPSVVLHKNDGLLINAGLKVSLILHNLVIRNKIKIQNDVTSEDVKFLSGNLGFQPHVRVRRNIGSTFFVQGTAGYELQDRRETLAPDKNGAYLADENSEPVHLQGSGFRFSAGVGFVFPSK